MGTKKGPAQGYAGPNHRNAKKRSDRPCGCAVARGAGREKSAPGTRVALPTQGIAYDAWCLTKQRSRPSCARPAPIRRSASGAPALAVKVPACILASSSSGCTRRVSHMGAYGALDGGGRAGARWKGAKTGRYKGWRQPASAKFLAFVSLLQSFSPTCRCRAAGGHENKKEKSSTAQEGPRYDGCKAERQQKQSEAACKVICTAA